MRRPRLTLLEAGHCVHPEHVVLRSRSLRPMRFPALFAVIEHPTEGVILYDTGYSQRFLDETRALPGSIYGRVTPVTLPPGASAPEQLQARGISPDDVRTIVISHFHADHVAALRDFPRARYVYFDRAWRRLRGRGRWRSLLKGVLPALVPPDFEERSRPVEAGRLAPLPPECAPFERGVDLLGDRSLLAVELPGHARGQLGLFVADEDGRRWFLVADACWTSRSWCEQRMPHPVARLLFDDWGAYRGTLHRIADFAVRHPDVRVVPSHCEEVRARFVRPG
ncbi:MAG: MBL fold metallo-hydrolase [Myxococcota bacterium]